MEPTALSAYSTFFKGVILVGLPFSFAMGAMGLWLALDEPANTASIAIFAAMSAGFLAMGWFGLRLLPFLHSSSAASPEGLHVFDRDLNETFYPWTSISHFRDWPALQVLDIYSKDGRRVLSVDYYVSNFEPFYQQVLESAHASA